MSHLRTSRHLQSWLSFECQSALRGRMRRLEAAGGTAEGLIWRAMQKNNLYQVRERLRERSQVGVSGFPIRPRCHVDGQASESRALQGPSGSVRC